MCLIDKSYNIAILEDCFKEVFMENKHLQSLVDDAVHKKLLLLDEATIGKTLSGVFLFVEIRKKFQKNEDGMIRHLILNGHMLMFKETNFTSDNEEFIVYNGKKYLHSRLSGSTINELFKIGKDLPKTNTTRQTVGGYTVFG